MTDRPILFSGPMVRAILDGRKTQTRRLIRKVRQDNCITLRKGTCTHVIDAPDFPEVLPVRAAVGDRLWIRESWNTWRVYDGTKPRDIPPSLKSVSYAATPNRVQADGPLPHECGKGRPSIFMPRWASRLTLTVTDVRVQRLQEISEEGAMAEGIMQVSDGVFDYHEHAEIRFKTARAAFFDLWDSLNAKRAPWADNPWIVAYTFTVEKRNIDQ